MFRVTPCILASSQFKCAVEKPGIERFKLSAKNYEL
jgi:hypothetical protein